MNPEEQNNQAQQPNVAPGQNSQPVPPQPENSLNTNEIPQVPPSNFSPQSNNPTTAGQPVVSAPVTGQSSSNSGNKKPLVIAMTVLVLLVIGAAAAFLLTKNSSDSANQPAKVKEIVSQQEIRIDMSRLSAGIGEFISNRSGVIPAVSDLDDEFISKYLKNDFSYEIVETEPAAGEIQYQAGYVCDDEGNLSEGSKRNYILRTKLEDNSYSCISV